MIISSKTQNIHVSHPIFEFFEFYSKYSHIDEYFELVKLEIFEFETRKYTSLKIQFQVESSSSFGFKLEKARLKNTQNISSIF